MELNTLDLRKRKVVCANANEEGYYFPNASELKVGEEYTLVWVNLYADKCRILLAEFPDKEFNSIHFQEVEDYQKPEGEPTTHEVMLLRELSAYCAPELRGNRQKLQAYLKQVGRTPKLICKGKCLPKVNCSGVVVNLAKYERDIQKLHRGDIYVIGRKGSVDINKELNYPFISRMQCYITKSMYGDGYEVYDVSANGTVVEEKQGFLGKLLRAVS